jgi:hypothetical protein
MFRDPVPQTLNQAFGQGNCSSHIPLDGIHPKTALFWLLTDTSLVRYYETGPAGREIQTHTLTAQLEVHAGFLKEV